MMPKLSVAFPMGACRPVGSLPPHRRDWRLMEHLRAFLDYLIIQNRSRHTQAAYESDLRQFFCFLARDLDRSRRTQSAILRLRAKDVTLDAVRGFLADLHRRGVTAQSANRKLVAIQIFQRYLRREGLRIKPTVQYLAPAKAPQPLPKWLTVDEVAQVLAVPDLFTLSGRRDAAILELLYASALRLSELVSLNLDDINLRTRWLRVAGKGGRQRMTPFNPCAGRALERYLKDRARAFLQQRDT